MLISAKAVQKSLKTEQDRVLEYILLGQVESFDQYRFMQGQAQGLQAAINIIEEANEKTKKNESAF